MCLWGYKSRTWARKAWMAWYNWAIRFATGTGSRRWPECEETSRRHFSLPVVTGGDQLLGLKASITMIQKIKRDARGFRNKDRFKAAIYFHLGGLDLYPEAVRKVTATHTNQ